MTLSSMTGFARSQGLSAPYAWTWEVKSVNAKSLDLRLRLPAGWDAIEIPVRARVAEKLARGALQAGLLVVREGVAPVVRVNEGVLEAVLTTMRNLTGRVNAEPPRLDGILGVKGVIEVVDTQEQEDERRAAEAAVLTGFEAALDGLVQMRREEGTAISQLLNERLTEISGLVERAHAAPGRRPEAIKQRLSEQVAILLDTNARLDPDRLHQEAILLATKADVREELDRLNAHVGQARKLMAGGGAIGRRLDFLAQELHRESNTLCAKSNDVELTNVGLELKTVVEQFREQVQNLE
jgi:uncharacterized protein (TIGR00255 family)